MKTFGFLPEGVAVLGIDPSLTGFAVTAMSVDDPTEYRTWVYRSDKRGVHRLEDITSWLEDRLSELQGRVVCVAMEGGVVHSQSAFVLGELHGVVKLLLADWGHYPLQVPPTSLKKYVAGKGTGVKKNEMLLKTYQKWGQSFTDDNAADSYGLARMARQVYLGTEPELKYEAEVLKKLNDPKFRDTARAVRP